MSVDPTALLVAALATIPASIAAIASLIGAKRTKHTHDEVRTNHGLRAGEYLELAVAGVNDLRAQLDAHTAQDEANFQALHAQLDATLNP